MDLDAAVRNHVRASRLTLVMASIFGVSVRMWDANNIFVCSRWRGNLYFIRREPRYAASA